MRFFVLLVRNICAMHVKTDVSLVILPVRGASLVGQLERLLFFLEGGSLRSETRRK